MENENKELDQNKSRKKKEPKTGWKAELISWIQVLVSAAVIAFVLTTFVIANSEVPTGFGKHHHGPQPRHRFQAPL